MSERSSAAHDLTAISRLMDLSPKWDMPWEETDFGPILEHQLGAPLSFDGGVVDPALLEQLDRAKEVCKPRIETLAEMLSHDHPPKDLLIAVRLVMKKLARSEDSPIPGEVARSIYFALIAVSMIRHDEPLTSLDRQSIQKGFDWCLAQTWLGADMVVLIRRASAL